MTIPEQALEAAARAICDVFREATDETWTRYRTTDAWKQFAPIARAALTSAAPLMGVERAAPPLRAREEIAREVAKIVDEPLGDGALAACDYMGDEAADDLRKAITRALSRTAGQEWRDISSAPKDGTTILAAFVGKTDIRRVCVRWEDGSWVASKIGLKTITCNKAKWWWTGPLPAPPVTEPIVAEKQTEIKP
jgi:hypothetical protein